MIYQPTPLGKVCSMCCQWKPAHQMVKRSSYTMGIATLCKPCSVLKATNYNKRNPDKRKQYQRNYYNRKKLSSGIIYLPYNPHFCARCGFLLPEMAYSKEQMQCLHCIDSKTRDSERRKMYKLFGRTNDASERRHADPLYRQMLAERKKIYKTSDRGRQKRRAWWPSYYKNHPEAKLKTNRKHREWEKSPRGKVSRVEAVRRRRAKEISIGVSFTAIEWQNALDYFDHNCAVCGRELNGLFHCAAMDHWIPISDPACPGTIVTNIVPLCHSIRGGEGGCNNTKSNRDPRKWLEERYGKHEAQQILNRIENYFEWAMRQPPPKTGVE